MAGRSRRKTNEGDPLAHLQLTKNTILSTGGIMKKLVGILFLGDPGGLLSQSCVRARKHMD
jgi:hypothetical protein